MNAINYFAYALFLLAMGYYSITNLQWYSYKLNRVVFHHTKTWWHFVYFIIPYALYMLVSYTSNYGFIIVIAYLALLFPWYRGLDKPLVWTGRVKRFYAIMVLFGLFITVALGHFGVLIPIFLAYFISLFIEKILFKRIQGQGREEDRRDERLDGCGDHSKLWENQYQELH